MMSIGELDKRYVWHPFTQHGQASEILPVRKAEGSYLELEDGSRILDAVSSWWVNIHGHGHPRIAEAIARQASVLDHVIFAGFTHEPAARLAEILVEATRLRGAELDRVFYSDNGSTAVEVALKLAFQFHRNLGDTGRTRFLALRGSYHGDTFGSMSVSEPEGFHAPFRELLAPVDFIEISDVASALEALGKRPCPYAALIVEPMVQGAGGMKMHKAEDLKRLETLCRESGTLLICDEIFTGFHRTGKCFAFEHASVKPDLLCLSKGLTGGYLPLSATLATSRIFDAFASTRIETAFLHGHSYTANPIACAAALASWELLQEAGCQERIARLSEITTARVEALKAHSNATQCRALGTIGAVDVKTSQRAYASATSREMLRKALDRGVLLRPLGNTLYVLPPYCFTDAELERAYDVLGELLEINENT